MNLSETKTAKINRGESKPSEEQFSKLISYEWIPPTEEEQRSILLFWNDRLPKLSTSINNTIKIHPDFLSQPENDFQLEWDQTCKFLFNTQGVSPLDAVILERLKNAYGLYPGAMHRITTILFNDLREDVRSAPALFDHSLHIAKGNTVNASPKQKARLLSRTNLLLDQFNPTNNMFFQHIGELKIFLKESLLELIDAEESQEFLTIVDSMNTKFGRKKLLEYASHEQVENNPPQKKNTIPIVYDDYTPDFNYSIGRFFCRTVKSKTIITNACHKRLAAS
jgi:hypothetical protein